MSLPEPKDRQFTSHWNKLTPPLSQVIWIIIMWLNLSDFNRNETGWQTLIYSSIPSFIHTFIHPFWTIHSSILDHSFIHSSIHSFICSFIYSTTSTKMPVIGSVLISLPTRCWPVMWTGPLPSINLRLIGLVDSKTIFRILYNEPQSTSLQPNFTWVQLTVFTLYGPRRRSLFQHEPSIIFCFCFLVVDWDDDQGSKWQSPQFSPSLVGPLEITQQGT